MMNDNVRQICKSIVKEIDKRCGSVPPDELIKISREKESKDGISHVRNIEGEYCGAGVYIELF
jgi:hypothetical protein